MRTQRHPSVYLSLTDCHLYQQQLLYYSSATHLEAVVVAGDVCRNVVFVKQRKKLV